MRDKNFLVKNKFAMLNLLDLSQKKYSLEFIEGIKFNI